MTKRRIQAKKREATKQLFYGISLIILGIIPILLIDNTDITGSIFVWIIGIIVIYDSIYTLYKLNICKSKNF